MLFLSTLTITSQMVSADESVENTDTGETFTTIQAAIDDPDTEDGHTIEGAENTIVDSYGALKICMFSLS
jgi:hypothetical protein